MWVVLVSIRHLSPTSVYLLLFRVNNDSVYDLMPIDILTHVRLVVSLVGVGYDQHHKSNPHLLFILRIIYQTL